MGNEWPEGLLLPTGLSLYLLGLLAAGHGEVIMRRTACMLKARATCTYSPDNMTESLSFGNLEVTEPGSSGWAAATPLSPSDFTPNSEK